jgi:hypothetical protein
MKISKRIKEMCNDVIRQNTCRASKMSENNSIVFYQDMKHSWCRDKYIECCTRKKIRMG